MGPVQENPDDLGYWATGAAPLSTPSSLVVCNGILSKETQGDIILAAFSAHEGYDRAAERVRREAGYDNIGFREDADGNFTFKGFE